MQVDMEETVMILKGCVVKVLKTTLVTASYQVSENIQIGKQSNKSNPLLSYSIKFSKKSPVTKGQTISKASYGVLNSLKKQTLG